MAVEVTLDHPDYPKGMEFDIGGILVENGKSISLDEDQELAFVGRNRVAVKDKLSNSPYIKVTGSPRYGAGEVKKMFPAAQPVEAPTAAVEEKEIVKSNEGRDS